MKDFIKTPADCWHKLSYFKIFQKPEEFVPFLEIIRQRSQAQGFFRALEIGSYAGGTAVLLAQYCDEVVGIDLNDPLVGCDNVKYIIGDSSDPAVFIKAEDHASMRHITHGRTIKGKNPGYDLLFIDGDHSAEASMRDYRTYETLVNKGGIIAFHDIVSSDHHRGVGCNVDITWAEVKKHAEAEGWETQEIIAGEDFWGGIGIVYKK